MQTRIAATDWRSIHAARLEAHEDVPESDRLDAEEKQRRGEQWRRTMFLSELIMGAPHGLPTVDLTERVNEWMGTEYHERTIYRDLDLLISLGLVERVRTGTVVRVRWCPHHHAVSRMVLSVVSTRKSEVTPRRSSRRSRKPAPIRRTPEWAALQGALDQLPPPWELDKRKLKAATSAARLLAMLDTGDSSYADGVLIYQLGSGWHLRRPGNDAPSRMPVLSAITLEEELERAEDARWELASADQWELVE